MLPLDFDGDIQELLNSVKVLVVGAGGIGCELLKNLVMTGFMSMDLFLLCCDRIRYYLSWSGYDWDVQFKSSILVPKVSCWPIEIKSGCRICIASIVLLITVFRYENIIRTLIWRLFMETSRMLNTMFNSTSNLILSSMH